jgi:hypothetical protein
MLSAGAHTIRVYGLENCCDGTMQGQFLAPGSSEWRTFGRADGLVAVEVPAPAAFAVFGLGLLGLSAVRKRRGA